MRAPSQASAGAKESRLRSGPIFISFHLPRLGSASTALNPSEPRHTKYRPRCCQVASCRQNCIQIQFHNMLRNSCHLSQNGFVRSIPAKRLRQLRFDFEGSSGHEKALSFRPCDQKCRSSRKRTRAATPDKYNIRRFSETCRADRARESPLRPHDVLRRLGVRNLSGFHWFFCQTQACSAGCDRLLSAGHHLNPRPACGERVAEGRVRGQEWRCVQVGGGQTLRMSVA